LERTISPEERIRRAEEIYYRRRQNVLDVRMPSDKVKNGNEKRQFGLYKKMIIQILICVLIYLVFSFIKEANYLFSEDIIKKTKDFLNQDIDFAVISEQIGLFFENNKDFFEGENSQNQEQQNIQNNSEQTENNDDSQNSEVTDKNVESKEENKQETENGKDVDKEKENNQDAENGNEVENEKEDKQGAENEVDNEKEDNNKNSNEEKTAKNNQTTGIGGGSSNEEIQSTSENGSAKKTQMEIDAQYIKNNFNFSLPVKGTITSRYGKREASQIVSANHQGIDIGVEEGTTIISAMEGIVSKVSDEGEYGIHVKITNKDITTVYAHCSKILVKEGEKVKNKQKIALSGNTGKTTGPHLHFEIQRSGRTIDPEMILTWE